jgi:hypothetical protein
LILACIVYWQAWEISQVLHQCDQLANGADLPRWNTSTPLERDNILLYGQFILDQTLARRRARVALSV